MKSATLKIALLFGLALATGGCASTRSTVSSYFNPSAEDLTEKQTAQNANAGQDYVGWDFLYWALTFVGQSLADK